MFQSPFGDSEGGREARSCRGVCEYGYVCGKRVFVGRAGAERGVMGMEGGKGGGMEGRSVLYLYMPEFGRGGRQGQH